MSNFLNKIPVSPITSFGNDSVPNGATFGTNFSILQTGGYMEVYSLSGLTYTIPPSTNGIIEFSGNSIPIQFTKGTGQIFSPDVLTLNSDNISSGRRKLGMLVYVYETKKIYQYTIDNYDTLWNNATGATGSGGSTVVISDYGTTVKNNSSAGIAFISAWTSSTISGVGGYNDTNSSWRVLQTGSSSGGTFTGGTVTGNTIFTSGLTANTISATTYLNLPSSTFTGGTVSGATRFIAGLTANTISATTYQNLPSTPFLPLSGGTVTGPVIIKDDANPLFITTTNYSVGSQGNILYFTDIAGTTNGKAINSRSNGGGSSGALILQQQGIGFVGVNTSSVNPTLNYNLDVNGSFGATSVSATTISATTYNGYEPADMRTDLTNRRLGYTVSTDFLSTFTAALAPFAFAGISAAAGTLASVAGQIDANHPGVQQIFTATGITNSGGYITSHAATNAFSVVFTNGLQTDLIFKLPPTTTNNTIRFGNTHGSLASTAPGSGNYFEITGTTLVGITRLSNVQSATSSFTLTASIWYHARVKETVVGGSNTVTFTIYDMSGTTLYNESSITNINASIARGFNVIGFNSVSQSSLTPIIYLDYLGATFPPMVRGALN